MPQNYRQPHHLPNRRGGEAAGPDELPRQRHGITPQMRGRYPEYDILEQADDWDPVTRDLIMTRLDSGEEIDFFDEREAQTLRAFCDVVTGQDREPRIPVLELVDQKLSAGRLDGYRYADMPSDDVTWKTVARGLDEAGNGRFSDAGPARRLEIVKAFAAGELTGGVWESVSCVRAWSVVMRAVLEAFYSHPWAWNEIGYGGPRYPRGYMRLAADAIEPGGASEAVATDPGADLGRSGAS